MKQLMIFIFLFLFAMAQIHLGNGKSISPCSGEEVSLNQFQWENRVIVMFAPNSDNDPYQHQMNRFSSLKDELQDRNLVLISIFDEECATLDGKIISDSSADDIRSRLAPLKHSYSFFLIGKDSGVKLKQNKAIAPDELFRVIDRMPMRQREIRDGR